MLEKSLLSSFHGSKPTFINWFGKAKFCVLVVYFQQDLYRFALVIFQTLQSRRTRAIWLAYENFTRANLSQVAVEIMSLARALSIRPAT